MSSCRLCETPQFDSHRISPPVATARGETLFLCLGSVASTTSESTSSTSTCRCRRCRRTDVDDVDLWALTCPLHRLRCGGRGGCGAATKKATARWVYPSCRGHVCEGERKATLLLRLDRHRRPAWHQRIQLPSSGKLPGTCSWRLPHAACLQLWARSLDTSSPVRRT